MNTLPIPKFCSRNSCIWVEDDSPMPLGTPIRENSFRPFYGHGSLESKFDTDIFSHYDGVLQDVDRQEAEVNGEPCLVLSAVRKAGDQKGRCGLLVFPCDEVMALDYIANHNRPSGVFF